MTLLLIYCSHEPPVECPYFENNHTSYKVHPYFENYRTSDKVHQFLIISHSKRTY